MRSLIELGTKMTGTSTHHKPCHKRNLRTFRCPVPFPLSPSPPSFPNPIPIPGTPATTPPHPPPSFHTGLSSSPLNHLTFVVCA